MEMCNYEVYLNDADLLTFKEQYALQVGIFGSRARTTGKVSVCWCGKEMNALLHWAVCPERLINRIPTMLANVVYQGGNAVLLHVVY